MKKSIVITSAISSVSLSTAASSAVFDPTSTRGSSTAGRPRTIGSSAAAGSLHPQPAPCASDVSAIGAAADGSVTDGNPSAPRVSRTRLRAMSILGDIVGDALGNVFTFARSDKKLERLHEEGELVPATVYAIRIVSKGDSADEYSYGLDLATSAGPLRASVRQQLAPDPWRAPLGARVLARHLAGAIAIDWPATLDEAGVRHQASFIAIKTLKTPLPPGIDDERIDRKRLRDGIRTEAQIISSEPYEVMGMPTQNRRLELRVDDGSGPRTVLLKRALIPPYAWALAVTGVRVPVAIDPKRPDRVTIDWPSAAEAVAAR